MRSKKVNECDEPLKEMRFRADFMLQLIPKFCLLILCRFCNENKFVFIFISIVCLRNGNCLIFEKNLCHIETFDFIFDSRSTALDYRESHSLGCYFFEPHWSAMLCCEWLSISNLQKHNNIKFMYTTSWGGKKITKHNNHDNRHRQIIEIDWFPLFSSSWDRSYSCLKIHADQFFLPSFSFFFFPRLIQFITVSISSIYCRTSTLFFLRRTHHTSLAYIRSIWICIATSRRLCELTAPMFISLNGLSVKIREENNLIEFAL